MPTGLIGLADAGRAREQVGGKAAVLGELATQGWPVPPGFVVTADALSDPDLAQVLAEAAERCAAGRFAVRSSGVAEDLPDASYAGLYETFLDVGIDGLADTVHRCFAAAQADRVRSYHDRHAAGGGPSGMAVLVQVMVDASAAGVAFTAHPVTGARDQILVTAVAGVGDALVAGEQTGEEWTITGDRRPQRTRRAPDGADVLDDAQAGQVAAMAVRVAAHYGQPQDLEWAIDTSGTLWLLQARPMTALPEPVTFTAPGPGLWMRNFRLGEWLPDPMTPLFRDWLLEQLHEGFVAGARRSSGAALAFPSAAINGWYYTMGGPSLRSLPRTLLPALVRTRGSSTTTLPRSLWLRIRRPNPWRNLRIASGSEWSPNGSRPFARSASRRACTSGWPGLWNGSRVITSNVSASPRRSIPSQRLSVPISTEVGCSRFCSIRRASGARKPAETRRTKSHDVQSTRPRPPFSSRWRSVRSITWMRKASVCWAGSGIASSSTNSTLRS